RRHLRHDRRVRGHGGPLGRRRRGELRRLARRALVIAMEVLNSLETWSPRSARRVIALAAAVACSLSLACARDGGSNSRVRIAIGGQTQLVYLPTTLAQELGFYKEEGLDVELQDFEGGA